MKKRRASLTVEASLVFPIFILVILGFLYFMQLFILQERIQSSITEVSKFASRYAYLYERVLQPEGEEKNQEEADNELRKIMNGLISGTIYRGKFLEYLGEDKPNDFCVEGGLNAVSFIQSSFMKEDEKIEIVATYDVRIPMLFFSTSPFHVVQKVKTRAFVGYSCLEGAGYQSKETDTSNPYVYITKTGVVYHKDSECTYIKYKIQSVSMESMEQLRNTSGGIYYPCESCVEGKNITLQSCYITSYGDRYHSEASCNKLKRTIIKVRLSQVAGRKPCSKCGGE